MILYKTYTIDNGPAEPVTKVSWQASQTEASRVRGAAKKAGLKAESQTVNIPTAKGPLLEWLNENVTA